jgi:cytochrome P450
MSGRFYHLWFRSTVYLVLRGLIDVDETIADKIQRVDDLPKAQEIYHHLKSVLGPHSMITVEGDHWQKLRKMFNPAFSQGHLDTLVPGIVEETLVLVTKLNAAAQNDETVLMLDAITVFPFLTSE